MSAAKNWGMTLAMAACFGLVAGGVFIGTAAVGTKVIGTATEQKQEVTIPTTTTTTAADSSDTSDTVKATGEMSVKDVASSAMPSLVAISTTTVEEVETFFGTTSQEVPASGTGVIVGQNDDELLIATNNHVVSGATSLSVSFIDDETVEGQIKGPTLPQFHTPLDIPVEHIILIQMFFKILCPADFQPGKHFFRTAALAVIRGEHICRN